MTNSSQAERGSEKSRIQSKRFQSGSSRAVSTRGQCHKEEILASVQTGEAREEKDQDGSHKLYIDGRLYEPGD